MVMWTLTFNLSFSSKLVVIGGKINIKVNIKVNILMNWKKEYEIIVYVNCGWKFKTFRSIEWRWFCPVPAIASLN